MACPGLFLCALIFFLASSAGTSADDTDEFIKRIRLNNLALCKSYCASLKQTCYHRGSNFTIEYEQDSTSPTAFVCTEDIPGCDADRWACDQGCPAGCELHDHGDVQCFECGNKVSRMWFLVNAVMIILVLIGPWILHFYYTEEEWTEITHYYDRHFQPGIPGVNDDDTDPEASDRDLFGEVHEKGCQCSVHRPFLKKASPRSGRRVSPRSLMLGKSRSADSDPEITYSPSSMQVIETLDLKAMRDKPQQPHVEVEVKSPGRRKKCRSCCC